MPPARPRAMRYTTGACTWPPRVGEVVVAGVAGRRCRPRSLVLLLCSSVIPRALPSPTVNTVRMAQRPHAAVVGSRRPGGPAAAPPGAAPPLSGAGADGASGRRHPPGTGRRGPQASRPSSTRAGNTMRSYTSASDTVQAMLGRCRWASRPSRVSTSHRPVMVRW